MVNNIMIKNNSFIQSMHNNIQCLSLDTAVRPCDRCWFTSKQIQDWADMNKDTLNRKLEKLVRVGRIVGLQETTNNIIDIDKNNGNVESKPLSSNLSLVENSINSDIIELNLQHETGSKITKLYNLNVLNHLAMVELDNDKLNTVANKFSDILSEVETTGQYNVQKQDPSYMIEDPIERAKAWIREQEEKRALEAEKNELITHNKALEKNKDLQSTNDELVTEVEILLNSYVNTKQVYEMYLQNYPEAPNQAKSTMLGKIRKALCNICNERKTGRKIYKKHILNQKNEIEWRQEYFFDQDTKQILFDRVEDDLNYIVNIKLR